MFPDSSMLEYLDSLAFTLIGYLDVYTRDES